MNNKEQEISLFEKLLNKDNLDSVTLNDEEGNAYEFEQVVSIFDERRLFCILHPITKIEGIEDDEAGLFE